MIKLAGKPVGYQLLEIVGPSVNENYFIGDPDDPKPANLHVQVFGTGSVTIQTCDDLMVASPWGPTPNSYSRTLVPDPANWSDVDTVDASDGLETIALTPTTSRSFIRIIVATAGDGQVFMSTEW